MTLELIQAIVVEQHNLLVAKLPSLGSVLSQGFPTGRRYITSLLFIEKCILYRKKSLPRFSWPPSSSLTLNPKYTRHSFTVSLLDRDVQNNFIRNNLNPAFSLLFFQMNKSDFIRYSM